MSFLFTSGFKLLTDLVGQQNSKVRMKCNIDGWQYRKKDENKTRAKDVVLRPGY